MLVGEASAGVDVGEDGEYQHRVFTLPGFETLERFLGLGFHETLVVGGFVFPGHHGVVQLPFRDGGRGIFEHQRLAFVEVEELDLDGVLPLGEHLGHFFLNGSVGAVVHDEEFPVHVEAAAVVGSDGEVVLFFLLDRQGGFEQGAEVVLGVVQILQVQIGLDALYVGFSQGVEICGQVPFRPIVPDFVVNLGLVPAGDQQQRGCQKGEGLFHIVSVIIIQKA